MGLEHTTCTCSPIPASQWSSKNGKRKSTSPFITLPLVVLAVVQSISRVAPYAKNGELKIISLLKIFVGT